MWLRNDRSWSSLVTALVRHGDFQQAIDVYLGLQLAKPPFDGYAFAALLKACTRLKDASTGVRLHAHISATSLLQDDIFLGNGLIDMYAKCGFLDKAQEVFDMLPVKDVVSWTSMIAGYSRSGAAEEALDYYTRMQLSGVSPNAITYVCSLKACASIGAVDKGYEIHLEVCRKGLFETNLFVGSALVDMYAKCGALGRAHELFDKLPAQDLVAWNALIAGYADHEKGNEAVDLYEKMQLAGFSPDAATFVSILKACAGSNAIDKGQEIHSDIAQRGLLEREIDIGNAVIHMYAQCGSFAKAWEVFNKLPLRNKVSWNALIAGYTKHEEHHEVLSCIDQMQLEGFSPDDVTLVCLLNTCSTIENIRKGQHIHFEIARKHPTKHSCVVGSALIDMYAKCGFLVKAKEVFDYLEVRNVILWTALIAGYVQHEFAKEALDCLEAMILEGITPNNITYACCLRACNTLGATLRGRELHAEAARNGLLEQDIAAQNILVEMYARSGMLAIAQEVFDKLPSRDLYSWNALMSGYAHVGDSLTVLQSLQKLKLDDLLPDFMTFCNVLDACNVTGMLDMGHFCIDAMLKHHDIGPTMKHHTCMIDLYGRAGQLDKAIAWAKRLPFDPDFVICNVVLNACQRWGNLELAKSSFEQVK